MHLCTFQHSHKVTSELSISMYIRSSPSQGVRYRVQHATTLSYHIPQYTDQIGPLWPNLGAVWGQSAGSEFGLRLLGCCSQPNLDYPPPPLPLLILNQTRCSLKIELIEQDLAQVPQRTIKKRNWVHRNLNQQYNCKIARNIRN